MKDYPRARESGCSSRSPVRQVMPGRPPISARSVKSAITGCADRNFFGQGEGWAGAARIGCMRRAMPAMP